VFGSFRRCFRCPSPVPYNSNQINYSQERDGDGGVMIPMDSHWGNSVTAYYAEYETCPRGTLRILYTFLQIWRNWIV